MTDPATIAAVDRLYRDHHDTLRGGLIGRTGCTVAYAEDALSHAYAKLLRRGDPACATPGYVYVTARRVLWETRRRQFREPWLSLDGPLPRDEREVARDETAHLPLREIATGGTDLDAIVEARDRLRAVADLPWHQRQALTDEMQGYSMQESAERRGQTYTWVNRHRREGRQAFREAIAA